MALKDILKKKTVSVWGLGYLGYTTILKMQNNGFNILAYDPNVDQLNQFVSGKYPGKERLAAWSSLGYMPKLDYSKIKVVGSPSELFKSSNLHMIAIPEKDVTTKLADIFARNLKKQKITLLIIFEWAFIPGHIEKNFVTRLKDAKLTCSRDYYLGAIFRTDWSIEAFINQKDKMPIAGYCSQSSKVLRDFFSYIDIPTIELDSLKSAEVYVNSLNVVQAMVNDFVRQLAIGYPSVNIKKLSNLLFKNIALDDCALNIGTGGTRMTYAIDHLIQGSDNPEELTLLKEFQDINISSVLNCAEYIIRHSYNDVTILGVTYKGNQKDLTLSPAVTLANHLIKNSVKVLLNDPFCSQRELRRLAKGTRTAEFPKDVFSTEVLVLASDHNEYKYLSQGALDAIKNKKTKLIIDNYGIWSNLSFGKRIKYYQVGDGSLNLLK